MSVVTLLSLKHFICYLSNLQMMYETLLLHHYFHYYYFSNFNYFHDIIHLHLDYHHYLDCLVLLHHKNLHPFLHHIFLNLVHTLHWNNKGLRILFHPDKDTHARGIIIYIVQLLQPAITLSIVLSLKTEILILANSIFLAKINNKWRKLNIFTLDLISITLWRGLSWTNLYFLV